LLIPGTILMGAVVALGSALIAELPGSNETLPLNAVTAFVGAPVVIWVIIGRRAMQKSFGG
jgi:iron complex transport system permease protein